MDRRNTWEKWLTVIGMFQQLPPQITNSQYGNYPLLDALCKRSY